MDDKIRETNDRLKKAGTRVLVVRRNNRLWLRGILPPKPHIDRVGDYRQSISLGRNAIASDAGLKYAIQKAQIITGQLIAGKFDWADWQDTDKVAPTYNVRWTVGEWVHRYEEAYWQKTLKTPSREVNWKKDHGLVFSRLPLESDLTLSALLTTILATTPDSRSRKRACDYCYSLAEFAEIEGREAIKKLKGNYSAASVNPRTLPTDSAIAQFCDTITNPGWQWIIRVMAVYGLRNHEAFRLDMKDFPIARVLQGKTGKRFVLPLYPEWATQWELNKISLPNIENIDFNPNSTIGTKVSSWFYDNKAPFSAYNLRHAYARRCCEFNIAPDRAAFFMGHSLDTHMKVYRAWFDESIYLASYNQAIAQPNRPLPPSY